MTGSPVRAVVFSDLDGTLLDHSTYSWQEAEPGLHSLQEHGIPLIPSTSKTLAEVRELVARMDLGHVAIIENGAAICWGFDDPGDLEVLGPSYQEIREGLGRLKEKTPIPLVGFGDADSNEIAAQTGLDPQVASLAKQRLGDEPFWTTGTLEQEAIDNLQEQAHALGLELTRGGRFFHLKGDQDKGTAARRILHRMTAAGQRPRSAAFGDAANDQPLLRAVDRGFAVRRPGGAVDPVLAAIPAVTVCNGIGPAGFSEGVQKLLDAWADLVSSPGG